MGFIKKTLPKSSNHARTKRLPQLDVLRGFFVVVILIDHLALWPSLLMFFTGRNELWFSAAEGFMAVSGFLVGYVYYRKFLQNKKAATLRILRRALILYATTIALGAFCMAYVSLLYPHNTTYSFQEQFHKDGPLIFILDNLSLNYSYLWAEYLSNYVSFLALSPIALWLISKGKWWTVGLLSTAVWYFALPEPLVLDFNRPSWQIIYFVSLIIGTFYPTISAFIVKHSTAISRRSLSVALWISALILMIMSTYLTYGYGVIKTYMPNITDTPIGNMAEWWWSSGWATSELFDKGHLGILRLVTGTIILIAMFTFLLRFYRPFTIYTAKVFENIGKRGLYAYVIHSIILTILLMQMYVVSEFKSAIILNTFTSLSACIFLWLIVYKVPTYIATVKANRS